MVQVLVGRAAGGSRGDDRWAGSVLCRISREVDINIKGSELDRA